jgi:solute:Na+ symporter, SSS family
VTLLVKILLVLTGTILTGLSGKGQNVNLVEQRHLGSLRHHADERISEGLAGSFAGVHNNVLIVAGGSNFAGLKPWEGGSRIIYDKILVAEIVNGNLSLFDDREFLLNEPVAHGAAVSLPSGVICTGGQTPGGLTGRTFILSWQGSDLVKNELPSLPFALRDHSAAAVGNIVYVAGGETENGVSRRFMSLDMNDREKGWTLLPDMPVGLSGLSLVAQTDGEEPALFVIGGRSRNEATGLTEFYSSVFKYSISSGSWTRKNNISLPGEDQERPVSVAAASAIGAVHILLAGGDKGEVFRQVEREMLNIQQGDTDAVARRDSLWISHPGFSNKILAYNTITDKWFLVAELEGDVPAVTSLVWWDGRLVMPGGEIRPGIRTADITGFSVSSKPVFGGLNYSVLILYFCGMLLLGFFFLRRGNTTDDFFKAGGRIPWWAAGISIFATTLSAITFIAIPAKAYATDWRMFIFNMSIILIAPVIIRYYLPFFRRLNLSTAYEYLELRFNRTLRLLASGLFVSFMVSRIAIVLFLPSLALHAVTGFSVYWAIAVMGIVTIIYCTSGGIEAVVWGDVIQGFILVAGALTAFAFMLSGTEGGIAGFMDTAAVNDKFHLIDFSPDFTSTVIWVVIIGGLANTLITFTSDQSVVQRYMTTKDERATGRSIWLNGILSVPVSVVFFLLGTGLFAFYSSNPERLALTNPNIDATFPQFIVGELPAGMAGLLIAAIFAAAMSTLSSNINSVAAVITSDFYKLLARQPSRRNIMFTARISGVVAGITGIIFALMLATWDIASLWDQFNVFLGLLTGGLGGLFLMGVFFDRISAGSALTGLIGGIAVLAYVQNATELSFLLYGAIGMTASLMFALFASLFFPNQKPIKGYTYSTMKKKS